MTELCRQGKTPDSSTRALWKSYQQSNLVAYQKYLAKEMLTSALRIYIFHTSKGPLTCHQILRHGTNGFTFLPKEVLRIFIAIKSSLSSGLNPWILGTVAITLTTRPQMSTDLDIVKLLRQACSTWKYVYVGQNVNFRSVSVRNLIFLVWYC
jgi:hypothetical protein